MKHVPLKDIESAEALDHVDQNLLGGTFSKLCCCFNSIEMPGYQLTMMDGIEDDSQPCGIHLPQTQILANPDQFVEELQRQLARIPRVKGEIPLALAVSEDETSVEGRLQQLKRLREDDLISEEDYQRRKDLILDEMTGPLAESTKKPSKVNRACPGWF